MFCAKTPFTAAGPLSMQTKPNQHSLNRSLLLTALLLGSAMNSAQAADGLYVLLNGSNAIKTYIPPSSAGTVFTSGGYLSNPTGMAFDSAGNLFVANHNSSTITKFAFTGGVLSSTGTLFADSSSGVVSPWGLAFDSAGNLFLANTGGIEKFAYSGGSFSAGTVFASRPGHAIFRLAFDGMGSLFATDASDTTLTKFTAMGGVLSNTGTTFANMDGRGLAFDNTGSLFMSRTNNTIVKFTATAGVLSSIGTLFSSSGLNNPYSLAFDSTGNLFVANNISGAITEFASAGGVLSSTSFTFASGPSVSDLAFAPSAVPEPGTAFLLVIGGATLALKRRMKGAFVELQA